jgi:hypothetical protein
MIIVIAQSGLGPITQLGFGPSGQPASIPNAPAVEPSAPTDFVLIQRAGQLQKIPMAAFMAIVPPQSDGYPPGGYWLTRQGRVELAPACDLSKQTDNNLLITLLAMGFL